MCQSFSCFFFFLSLFLFLFFFIPWHLTFVSEVTVCLNSNVPTMSDMYSVMLISSQLYRLGIITFLQWSSLNIFHGIINYSLWEYPSLAWTWPSYNHGFYLPKPLRWACRIYFSLFFFVKLVRKCLWTVNFWMRNSVKI